MVGLFDNTKTVVGHDNKVSRIRIKSFENAGQGNNLFLKIFKLLDMDPCNYKCS